MFDEHPDGGGGGFKDREDQSIGDPFRVSGAEFRPFLSGSCPVRRPQGDGGTGGERRRRRGAPETPRRSQAAGRRWGRESRRDRQTVSASPLCSSETRVPTTSKTKMKLRGDASRARTFLPPAFLQWPPSKTDRLNVLVADCCHVPRLILVTNTTTAKSVKLHAAVVPISRCHKRTFSKTGPGQGAQTRSGSPDVPNMKCEATAVGGAVADVEKKKKTNPNPVKLKVIRQPLAYSTAVEDEKCQSAASMCRLLELTSAEPSHRV